MHFRNLEDDQWASICSQGPVAPTTTPYLVTISLRLHWRWWGHILILHHFPPVGKRKTVHNNIIYYYRRYIILTTTKCGKTRWEGKFYHNVIYILYNRRKRSRHLVAAVVAVGPATIMRREYYCVYSFWDDKKVKEKNLLAMAWRSYTT